MRRTCTRETSGSGHADRDDGRYRAAEPWAHGRFDGEPGPQRVWRMRGGNRTRFEIDGGWFEVASADYPYVGDWLWDADNIVLYPDPDYDGYYIAYNVRLGRSR